MDIDIPSPSVFLRQSPLLSASVPVQRPVQTATQPTNTARTRPWRPLAKSNVIAGDTSAQNGGTATSKRSKSRNGCWTCKKKRLKCDETKPTCVQCEKRNVECGGYKKDYKWRSFVDTPRQVQAGKAKNSQNATARGDAPIQEITKPAERPSSSQSNREPSWSPGRQLASTSPPLAINGRLPSADQDEPPIPHKRLSPSHFDPLPIFSSGFTDSDVDLPSPLPATGSQPSNPHDEGGRSSFADVSPTLVDTLLRGTDLRSPHDPPTVHPPRLPVPYEATLDTTSLPWDVGTPDDDDNEEAGEEFGNGEPEGFPPHMSDSSQWRLRAPSPANSQIFTDFSQPTNLTLLRAPRLDPSSPEMLMLRFDRETCGILSIKDGPSENPWRTLVWPLAQDSQALYHAISAMAALHGATTQPRLRLTGMAHMTKSISKLSAELHKMSFDQILASALALALGEGWDDKFSTGIQHLKGAKTLLNNALAQRSKSLQLGLLSPEDAHRLRFLSNTYVYLDAIARLTSNEEHDYIDLDHVVQAVNEPMGSGERELDPLMGCATTLFPLLGKVGSLIQRVRRTPTNSLSIVSEANELREQLLQWEPPDMDLFEQPEDPSSNVRHALQTAEAYRRATLLHLHSAVTELSSDPSYDQAKATLTMLAATPLSSRTLIVQIFPLLVGSCEMVDPDDRRWVTDRWDAMMKRLTIVNVSSCWEVVKEVWRRRDHWVEMQTQRMSRIIGRNVSPVHLNPRAQKRKIDSTHAVTEDATFDTFSQADNTGYDYTSRSHTRSLTLDASGCRAPRRQLVRLPRRHTDVSLLSGEIGYTVRGHLHWLGVMSDWNWEGKSLILVHSMFAGRIANKFLRSFSLTAMRIP